MQLRIIIILMAMSFSAPSLAATISFPSLPTFSISFPFLNGSYTDPNKVNQISFDLGMQFSSIATASIAWTATGTAGSYQVCPGDIEHCYTSSINPVAGYHFTPEPGHYGEAGSLSLTSPNSTLWRPNLLLDGKGTLYFGHAQMAWLNSDSVTILSNPTFEVSDVTLTIQGVVSDATLTAQSTVVPLPAALPLLVSGLTGLLFFQRKRKQA